MATFDIIILIILSGFVFYGLFFGLIKIFGLFFSIIAGVYVACHYYLLAFDLVKNIFSNYAMLGKILVFVIIFYLVKCLISFLFALLNNAFDLISIIPFLKSINRLAGAILGFLAGSLLFGLVLAIVLHYAGNVDWLKNIFAQSKIAPLLLRFINTLGLSPILELLPTVNSVAWLKNIFTQLKATSFIPQIINALESLLPNILNSLKAIKL